MTATLLVVEDDVPAVETLVECLEADGHRVRVARTGTGALGEGSLVDIDVVILDLDVDDLDGLDVCRHLRQRTQLPIIALSRDPDETRRVAALDLGADDVLSMPVSTPELLARVRVAMRHRRALGTVADDEVLDVGLLRIDPAAHEAMVVDRPLDLTAKEFALLTVLARNAGKVVPHAILFDRVWGADTTMETLRTHVSQLRRKVAAAGWTCQVVSEAGVGYRLDADPTAAPASES